MVQPNALLGLSLMDAERCSLLISVFYRLLTYSPVAHLGVFIDARLVLDVLGSVGVPQRAYGFVKVVVSWPNVGNHHCLGVASKRVLHSSVSACEYVAN